MAANWRKYVDERPSFGTGWERRIVREIQHKTDAIDSHGDDYCPPKLYQERAQLRRRSTARHEIGYDDSESRALRLFWIPVGLLIGPLLWIMVHRHSSGWVETTAVVCVYIAGIVTMLPALDVAPHIASRRLLYVYLGPRQDLPVLPAITWTPGKPRIPRPRHITRAVKAVLGADPVPVDTITTEQVDQIRVLIDTWCGRTWSATARAILTVTRRRTRVPDTPATSPRFRMISWNVAEYGRPGAAQQRQPFVEQAIRDERPAVALLQEIYAPTFEEAQSRVRALAQATGLACEVPDGRVTVAFGGHEMHTAILWDPEHASPVAGTWRFYGAGELWHAMVVGTLAINGTEISVASYHGPSLGKDTRAREAERIMHTATSAFTRDTMIICGDFNSLSNARTPDGTYYDTDPYHGKPAHPEHMFQVNWTETADGDITDIRADRRPAEILSYGKLLHDAAPALGRPWQPTIGHWYPDGPHGLRRIDLAWGTTSMLAAIVSCEPVSTPDTRKASDHLPLRLVVDSSRLPVPLTTAATQTAESAATPENASPLSPQRLGGGRRWSG